MATTVTDRLSVLPSELRLMLYSIIFPPNLVLQIRRRWLSSSNVSHGDVWGDLIDPSLRQRYCKHRIDYWPPHIEDAYLEATMTATPDNKRRSCRIISDTIRERTGEKRTRDQILSHYDLSLEVAPSPTVLRAFLSHGSPRLQPLPHHFQLLILLNRSFHREAVDYLYSEAVLDFGEDVEAIPLFLTQIGPESTNLIKHIRLEHIERPGKSGGEGTLRSLDLLETPLRTLLPNLQSLQSLHLAICPWPYYIRRSKVQVPPWATSMEQLGRLLSTVAVKIHLTLGFESGIAFPDRQYITVKEKSPREDQLPQLPESGLNPLDCIQIVLVPHKSRLTCTNNFWRIYQFYNQSNKKEGPSTEGLLWVLYRDQIPNPKPGTLFPPLHPDEVESLKAMRYLNASTVPGDGDVIVPHTWLRELRDQQS